MPLSIANEDIDGLVAALGGAGKFFLGAECHPPEDIRIERGRADGDCIVHFDLAFARMKSTSSWH